MWRNVEFPTVKKIVYFPLKVIKKLFLQSKTFLILGFLYITVLFLDLVIGAKHVRVNKITKYEIDTQKCARKMCGGIICLNKTLIRKFGRC